MTRLIKSAFCNLPLPYTKAPNSLPMIILPSLVSRKACMSMLPLLISSRLNCCVLGLNIATPSSSSPSHTLPE